MHIEFLVEEPSAAEALMNVVPGIIGGTHSFDIHYHQGKRDLLRKLPARLRGYHRWIPDDWRIVVLVDEDRKDCHAIKNNLEETAAAAGFHTKTTPDACGRFQVLNRLAIEELEAWFFGDVEALRWQFPKIPTTLDKKAKYRNPDSIAGGTREALEAVLQRAGYYKAGVPKIEAARLISIRMHPFRNRSRSFQNFMSGLQALVD